MLDVQTELDRRGVSRMVVTPARSQPISSQLHLFSTDWGWQELRDYVASQIETRFGPFHRDSIREAAIFKRFIKDWGEQSEAIARHAFEVYDGLWGGTPVTVNRFCRGADPYFAQPISERLSGQF